MTRRGKGIVLVVIGGIAAAGAWRLLRHAGETSATAVPVMVMRREAFVRRVTAEGNLKPVKATPVVVPLTGGFGPMKIAWLAEDGAHVKGGEVVARFDATDLEKTLKDGEADLAAAQARLQRERIQAQDSLAERERHAELARTELEHGQAFQQEDQEIFSRNAIVESRIDQTLAQARMDQAQGAKGVEAHLSRTKVELIDSERKKAQLTITQAKQGLQSLEVTAPHEGLLVLERDDDGSLPRVGQQIWRGQTIAEIPVLEDLEAEVFVLEVDGGGLAEKQRATVLVEAQPGVEHTASVLRVDKLAKPRIPEQPVQYFGVTLKLEHTDPAVMKPGQRVRATLVLDEEQALVAPRQAIFDKEGKTIVYRQKGTAFEPLEVQCGVSTAGRVVIKQGLQEGDRIALRDPALAPKEQGGAGLRSGAKVGGEQP